MISACQSSIGTSAGDLGSTPSRGEFFALEAFASAPQEPAADLFGIDCSFGRDSTTHRFLDGIGSIAETSYDRTA